MNRVWPYESIRELFALALRNGTSTATLPSNVEAKRFRSAIYNFRKKNEIGFEFQVVVEDKELIIKKQEPIREVSINQPSMEISV